MQATLAPPATGKMVKGLIMCYSVICVTFYSAAVSGYWVFGNKSNSNILKSLMPDDGPALAPTWVLGLGVVFVLLQLFAIGLVSTKKNMHYIQYIELDQYFPFYLDLNRPIKSKVSLADRHNHIFHIYNAFWLHETGLLPSSIWDYGTEIGWREARDIFHEEPHPEDHSSDSLRDLLWVFRGDASILRRHKWCCGSYWLHSSGLCPPDGPLQHDLQATKIVPHLLGQHVDHRGLLWRRNYGLLLFDKEVDPRCQQVQAVQQRRGRLRWEPMRHDGYRHGNRIEWNNIQTVSKRGETVFPFNCDVTPAGNLTVDSTVS